jgi:hypothetical protein
MADFVQNVPFDAIEIGWSIPLDIAAAGPTVWDKIHIYRSGNENSGYTLVQDQYGITLGEFPSQISSVWVTTWDDPTQSLTSKDSYYYLIRYYNSASQKESKFYLTWKALSPKEQRLVEQIKCVVTPWITQFCTDDDLRAGLILAMNAINMFPPSTNFTLDTFPTNLEPFLVSGSAAFALMFKYLGIAITDMSYSDMGFSLNIDRGVKIKTAIDMLMGFAGLGGAGTGGGTSLLALSKMDYMSAGASVGTIQLPISIGGNLNKGMLNVLDLLSSLGR